MARGVARLDGQKYEKTTKVHVVLSDNATIISTILMYVKKNNLNPGYVMQLSKEWPLLKLFSCIVRLYM